MTACLSCRHYTFQRAIVAGVMLDNPVCWHAFANFMQATECPKYDYEPGCDVGEMP